MSELGLDT